MLSKIDRFLRTTGMPVTTFGRRAVNDPHLIADLKRGRAIGTAVRARIEAFIAGPPA